MNKSKGLWLPPSHRLPQRAAALWFVLTLATANWLAAREVDHLPSAGEMAETHVLEQRKELVDTLSMLARDDREKSVNSPQALALELLGILRAVEAVPLLLEMADESFPAIVLQWTPLTGYPAASALADIGQPSLEGIRRDLGQEQDDFKLLVYAWIFRSVDGKEVALHRLALMIDEEEALRKEQLSEIRRHLESGEFLPGSSRSRQEPATAKTSPAVHVTKALADGASHLSRRLVEGLTADDLLMRKATRDNFVEERRTQIEGFIERVRSSRTPLVTQLSIVEVLGHMRAKEAVPGLLDMVAKPFPHLASSTSVLSGFPVAETLAQIASPALDHIGRELRTKKSDRELLLFSWIFRLVDGKKVALKRLQMMIDQTSDGLRSDQLQQVRALLARGTLPTGKSSLEQTVEELVPDPSSGRRVVYHDVDIHGRILEIDYAAASARIIGTLDLEEASTRLLYLGERTESGRMLLVFVEPEKEHGVWGRFHLYDPQNGTLHRTSLMADLTGEVTIAIPDQKLAYIQYFSRRHGNVQRFVLDMTKNVVVSDFEFNLRHPSLFGVSDKDPTKGYLINAQTFPLQTIDLETHRKLGRSYLSGELPHSRPIRDALGWRNLFVVALEPPFLLAVHRGDDRETQELRLLDADSLDLVARSGPLPVFSGKYLIETDEQQRMEILCVENKIEDGTFVEVGKVRRFRVPAEGTLMEEIPALAYDPQKQIVLRTREGSFEIFPRYSFDYVSLLEAGRTVMLQYPNGLPDGMSLREAYEILKSEVAKAASLPTKRLRIEPSQETP